MEKAKDEAEKSTGAKLWGGIKSAVASTVYSDGAQHAAADIGSTFQACLYSGWHTQSAAIDSPEQIAEGQAKDQLKNDVEQEQETPKVGLERE